MKKRYHRRIVRNSRLQKILCIYGDDFYHRRKDRQLSRIVRSRLKEDSMKEIREGGQKYE